MVGTKKGTEMARTDQGTTFGQWLKEHRKRLDITQEELADRIGCARETIKKIELGERRPSRQIADLLADYFRVPPDERDVFARFARSAGVAGAATLHEVDPGAPWREQHAHYTNLPIPPTPLIGREREIEQIRKQLLSERV